jgi:hypothetical protein
MQERLSKSYYFTAPILSFILLILTATLPFITSLDGGFIEDDRVLIQHNEEIRDWRNIPNLFSQTYWHNTAKGGLYRPLTIASFALDKVYSPSSEWFMSSKSLMVDPACFARSSVSNTCTIFP